MTLRSSGSFPPTGGRRFGKYQLLTELGRGGMATVYLAVAHSGIQDVRRPVVVKLLDDALRSDAEFVQMFARESKISIELSHPNVVLTHTVGQEEGRYYIAMEYLEGVTLREIMKQCGEWPLQDRLPLFGAMVLMLTGLSYVHDFQDHRGEHLGLIHRDIKPDNIFITTTGQVKLLDFGVAKAAMAGFEATLGAAVRGTVQYLPPEAAKAGESVDARSDLFSAGVILAELATGRRYWDGTPYTQILAKLAADDLPTLSSAGSEDVPPPLARMLERALHPEPAARYQTASELRRAVQSVLARQGYRVNSTDLARIVAHLYEPIRKQREELIRVGLEELDRARPPTGTWSVAASTSGQHVHTPPEVRSDFTSPAVRHEVEPTPTAIAAPSRTDWRMPAAVAAVIVLGVLVWILWPRGEPSDTPVAKAAVTKQADDAPPPTKREPAPPKSEPTPPKSEPPAAAKPDTPVAPVEPAPTTTAIESTSPPPPTVEPTSIPESSSTRSRSRGKKSKKEKSSSGSEPTPSTAASEPTPSKPPPSGKKVEIEPSPYTR